MLDLELRKCIQDDLERESYDQARGFKQEIEDGTLCQDLDQHSDEYGDKYHNYHPKQI